MKKISVNHNDYSFENKFEFEDLLNRVKALGGSIIKNGKKTCVLGVMMGCILLSANNIVDLGVDFVEMVDNFSTIYRINKDVNSTNDDSIQIINDTAILVSDVSSSIESKYYFKDNNLYDNEGNIIFLDEVEKPIYFVECNISDETFQNIHLSSSQTKTLCLDYSSIDDNFIQYLPNTIEELSLNKCNYITNLNDLAKKCPNITKISINAAASLSDLSFIYQLPNLKEISIYDSAYVTEELLNYLRCKNITTNITKQDVVNSQMVDEIVSRIITPEMSDKEKIQTVCLYVLDSIEYDIDCTVVSNANPLSCVLQSGKGVCASYAYFTNILLNKAGIKSFEVSNDAHGWNVIKMDDKYYYIDTTSMDGSEFYNFLLETLNMTKYYMIDTENTFTTIMSKPTDETTMIPESIIKDIQMGRDNKDIFEKYSGQIGNFGVILVSVLTGIVAALGPYVTKKAVNEIMPDLHYSIKKDYEENLESIGHKSR